MNLNENIIDDFSFIYSKTKVRPNKYLINDIFNGIEFEKVLDSFIENQDDDNYISEIVPYDDGIAINQKVFRTIRNNIWISYFTINKESDDFICNNIEIYYTSKKDIELVDKIKNELLNHLIPLEEPKQNLNRLFTINLNQDGLSVDPVIISSKDETYKYYNPETWKKINSWIKKSKKENHGLSFFYGEKGRGKTSILKYISENLDRDVLYIPTNHLDVTINSTEFWKFLKNSKYLIVIDDAEVVCNTNSILINNIHQLVDSILSESIGVQILLIFNSELTSISSTISNVNNIIGKVEFKKIKPDDASELLGKKITKDINLVDIFKPKEKEKYKISL